MQENAEHYENLIIGSSRALTTFAPLLPHFASVAALSDLITVATERGYLLPDEDEQVRSLFSNYLTTRAALLSVLDDLRPYVLEEVRLPQPKQPEVFLISFCTACMLMRSARFIVDTFRKQKFVWRKLDEAEPRFGIPRKQFTKIYRSTSSFRNTWIFLQGIRYFEKHKTELLAIESDETLAPVVALMRAEEPFIEKSKSILAKQKIKYRWHSFLRRHHSGFKKVTFSLFKISGSVIAELRNKWKRKRVTPIVQRKLAKILQPGDVIITRHDDAASNLFLPGHWPHGALYIGTEQQRQAIDETGEIWRRENCPDPCCVLEARKDGVRFRALNDTFNVDACVILRPKIKTNEIRDAIARGMTHVNKRYDFEFDFRRTDKLVCTEVIYRSYHGIGGIEFELKTRTGRVCLSAEDLLDYAVDGKFFEVLVVYGSDGNRFVTGERAVPTLIKSYRSS
ncbi:MAG: YiiX/YebB-like N1pC/P60 family cysteine hydrolase [Mariniblastus sp.]